MQGRNIDELDWFFMSTSNLRRSCGRIFVALGVFVASVCPSLTATVSAQAPIVINSIWAGGYNLSSPPGLFAGHIAFLVDVSSVNAMASVTATFAGRTVTLQKDSYYWEGDDMATASLPFGPTPIEIRATDTLGNSVATVISRIHDNPPSVEILSPQPDALARPNVRFHARCTDDGGPCQLTLEGVTGVTGANEIDRIVSLAELQRLPASARCE